MVKRFNRLALIVVVVFAANSAPINFPRKINHGSAVSAFGVIPNDGLDDTQGILNALKENRTDPYADYFGLPKMLYFPAGTYDVSDSMTWIGCGVTIQGQGMGETVFRLKNASAGYNNTARPKAVWKTIYYNMAFRQNFHDLTIRIGPGNPGAVALDYISSNVGTVKNVEIISEDGTGAIGIDMMRQWPGPCLLKNVRVQGFATGIRIGQAEYGPTFENITLSGQTVAGIDNQGNVIAIRGLTSTNSVQSIKNAGHLIILDATLTGAGATGPAIVSTGDVYARNVTSTGYTAPISSKGVLITQNPVTEYVSGTVYNLFPCPRRSLGLPVVETPEYVDTDTARWALFDPPAYGSNGGLQTALNSGRSTVVLPCGVYLADPALTVTVPATVRRIIGFDCVINGSFVFQVLENSPNPLIVERIGNGATIQARCNRPIVIKHGGYAYRNQAGAGDVYFEDAGMDSIYLYPGQRMYARQYNTESLGAPRNKITNDNASMWILGIKTEGAGTIAATINGGFSEILGTLVYPVTAFTSSSAAGFINTESNVSLVIRSTAYASMRNYPNLIQETRGGVTKYVTTSSGGGLTIPLYAGFDSTKALPTPPAGVVSPEGVISIRSASRSLVAVNVGTPAAWSRGQPVFDLRGRSLGARFANPGIYLLSKHRMQNRM